MADSIVHRSHDGAATGSNGLMQSAAAAAEGSNNALFKSKSGPHALATLNTRLQRKKRELLLIAAGKEASSKTKPLNPASIPSQYQTIHCDRHEEKGFNQTSVRFHDSVNDLPGPGYYRRDGKGLLNDSPSVSKRGYGYGFASKAKRFPRAFSVFLASGGTNENIGPGSYQPTLEHKNHKSFSVADTTASFHPRLIDDMEALIRRETEGLLPPASSLSPASAPASTTAGTASSSPRKRVPGPADYHIDVDLFRSFVEKNGHASIFKSKTLRSGEAPAIAAGKSITVLAADVDEGTPSLLPPKRVIQITNRGAHLAPGYYDIKDDAVRVKLPKNGAASFRSTTERSGVVTKQAALPGPGSYTKDMTRPSSSQGDRKTKKRQMPWVAPPAMSLPQATDPPGPGSYNIGWLSPFDAISMQWVAPSRPHRMTQTQRKQRINQLLFQSNVSLQSRASSAQDGRSDSDMAYLTPVEEHGGDDADDAVRAAGGRRTTTTTTTTPVPLLPVNNAAVIAVASVPNVDPAAVPAVMTLAPNVTAITAQPVGADTHDPVTDASAATAASATSTDVAPLPQAPAPASALAMEAKGLPPNVAAPELFSNTTSSGIIDPTLATAVNVTAAVGNNNVIKAQSLPPLPASIPAASLGSVVETSTLPKGFIASTSSEAGASTAAPTTPDQHHITARNNNHSATAATAPSTASATATGTPLPNDDDDDTASAVNKILHRRHQRSTKNYNSSTHKHAHKLLRHPHHPLHPLHHQANGQQQQHRHKHHPHHSRQPSHPNLDADRPIALSLSHGPGQGHHGGARAVFLSRVPRSNAAVLESSKHLPGPGSYHPVHDVKQSFHLNLEKKWIG